MKGKTVLITGATDGIGKRTAIEISKLGANLIVHGRNKQRGEQVVEEIRKYTNGSSIEYVHADLASLSAVRKLAASVKEKYDKLDVLINNAGVFMRGQTFSRDGYETTFAVNHLAHFSLSLQMLPLLQRAEQGRVITVSSVAHNNSPRIDFSDMQEVNAYIDYSAYALSKLANVLFASELAHKLKSTSVTSNSLHPGVVSTKLLQAGFGISGIPVEEGCKTSVFLASDPSLADKTGRYFANSSEAEASPFAYDPGTRKNLWDLSEQLCELRFSDFV
ncbi:MAG TPA: SDR family oxidoreductase [Bacteroidales bacterium]|nr:SDR family oxidoreductase [Bacteroidales bacterium]